MRFSHKGAFRTGRVTPAGPHAGQPGIGCRLIPGLRVGKTTKPS